MGISSEKKTKSIVEIEVKRVGNLEAWLEIDNM